MWVQLTPFISSRNVDECQIANTSSLNIVRGLDEVCAGDGTIGNEVSAIARLNAPGDLDTLCIAYEGFGTRLRRREDAKVV